MSAVDDEYAKLKVAELKDRLKARGLSVTGKKAELVARLQAADAPQAPGEPKQEDLQMENDDEFAELFGGAPAEPAALETKTVENPIVSGIDVKGGDDDLFMALYGEDAPVEQHTEETAKVVLEAPALDEEVTRALEAGGAGGDRLAEAEGDDGGDEENEEEDSGSDEESSDDDLMINLDANATDYEPSQVKFQKSAAFSGQSAGHIPGLGDAAARTAIGGIPRSAIPGMTFQSSAPPPARDPRQAATGPGDPRSAPPDPRMGPVDPRAPADPRDPRAGAQGGHAPKQFSMADAVFPSEWQPGLPCKLPGQTRVSPEEYKEFLTLGHGEIFSIDLDSVVDPPWMLPGTDPSDFFNYGMSMNDWKAYQDRVKQYRLEFTMRGQIQTFDQSDGLNNIIFARQQNAEGKDQSLQASMLDANAATYEAFVTSERPERTMWQRHGSPWEHTIVLTGFELDFGDDDQRRGRFNNHAGGPRPPFDGPRGSGFGGPPFRGGYRGRGRGRGRGRDGYDNYDGYNGYQETNGPKLGLGIGMSEDDHRGYRGGRGERGRGGRGRGGRFDGRRFDDGGRYDGGRYDGGRYDGGRSEGGRLDNGNAPVGGYDSKREETFVNRPRDDIGDRERTERRRRSRSRSPLRRGHRDGRYERDRREDRRDRRDDRDMGADQGARSREWDRRRLDDRGDRGHRDRDRDRRRPRSRSRSPRDRRRR
jgi:hypothetical protein